MSICKEFLLSPVSLLLVTILISEKSHGQDSKTTQIPFVTTFEVLQLDGDDIENDVFSYAYYPIFSYGKHPLDSQINQDIFNAFFEGNQKKEAVRSQLKNWANNGLATLTFRITYESDELLSFQIEVETCNAYCSHWIVYFNYSLVTGKPLTLTDVVDTTSDGFTELITQKRDSDYNREIKSIRELLENSTENDRDNLEWALQMCESCHKSFNIGQFALYSKYLELIEQCEFPHAIRCYSPSVELKFHYDTIKEYMRIEI